MTDYFDLSFRKETVGGPINSTQAWIDEERLRARSHLIVLIHGYNNTQEDATAAYSAFVTLQEKLVRPGADWAAGAAVVRVYWPGDANWGLVSFAYYPWAVSAAQAVARELAGMLRDLAAYAVPRLTVDFVAHSLGNRVLLRSLALAQGTASIGVRRVVHMAAAVPTWKLDDSKDADRLVDGVQCETGLEGNVQSLYSASDKVLRYAFPLGETISPEHERFFPVALGHGEWSSSVPHFNQIEAVGADHGDYWGSGARTPPDLKKWIAADIQKHLALGAPILRSTPIKLTRRTSEMPGRETPRRESSSAFGAIDFTP